MRLPAWYGLVVVVPQSWGICFLLRVDGSLPLFGYIGEALRPVPPTLNDDDDDDDEDDDDDVVVVVVAAVFLVPPTTTLTPAHVHNLRARPTAPEGTDAPRPASHRRRRFGERR